MLPGANNNRNGDARDQGRPNPAAREQPGPVHTLAGRAFRALPKEFMPRSIALFRHGAVVLVAVLAVPVAAQFRKPEAAIAYRRGAMTVMSAHFYRAAAMAYGRVPFDAKAVADNVEVATYLSKLPFAGFVEGSDKGNTEALPKIWNEMERFRSLAAKMQDEMTKLNGVAKGGDLELIRAQVGVTEKACKACHEAYTKE